MLVMLLIILCWHMSPQHQRFAPRQESCVVLSSNQSTYGKWNGRNCNDTYGYVCQRNVGELSFCSPAHCAASDLWKNLVQRGAVPQKNCNRVMNLWMCLRAAKHCLVRVSFDPVKSWLLTIPYCKPTLQKKLLFFHVSLCCWSLVSQRISSKYKFLSAKL